MRWWPRSTGSSTTPASPCSSPWCSTGSTAASRAGRTPRAHSARSTTACPTWCLSASRRPSSPTNGVSPASPSTARLWRRLGWLVCFFYAAAAALRLARFNSRSAVQDKHYFEGLPSPSAAAIVAALIWLASDRVNVGLPGLIVAFVVTACAGALMISRFAFYSFKGVERRRARALHANRARAARVRVHFPVSIRSRCCSSSAAMRSPRRRVWLYRKLFRRRTRGAPTPA